MLNIKKIKSSEIINIVVLTLVVLVTLSTMLGYNIITKDSQHFVYLADSFLQGKLSFQEEHAPFLNQWKDTAEWNGKKYWPLGPFPAILLMPFVALFGISFLQGYISFTLTVLNFYLLWQIAKKLGIKNKHGIWLASFFVFGSIYVSLAAVSSSWYFAQTITATLLILSLYEFFGYKRYWLIGIFLGLAMATRANLILAGLFFVLMILWDTSAWKEKFKKLFKLSAPITLCIILLLLYNYFRFENLFEIGYNFQNIDPDLVALRNAGLFSLKHIPANLYFFLFKGPNPVFLSESIDILKYPYIAPDPWGMGIFFTSPILLYVFSASWKNKLIKASWLTTGLVLLSIITYYGIGVIQIGYRYALDFYPFLYVILALSLVKKFTFKPKALIVLGIILNWYFLINLGI